MLSKTASHHRTDLGCDGNVSDWLFLKVNAAFERQTGMKDVVGRLGSDIAPRSELYWLSACDSFLKLASEAIFKAL